MTKREVEEYIMSQIFPNASHEVTAQNVRNAFAPIVEQVWTYLEGRIGDLSQLQTADKQSVVNAINAVLGKMKTDIDKVNADIATLGSKVGELEDETSQLDLSIKGIVGYNKGDASVTWLEGSYQYINNAFKKVSSTDFQHCFVILNEGDKLTFSGGKGTVAPIIPAVVLCENHYPTTTLIPSTKDTSIHNYTYTATANMEVMLSTSKALYQQDLSIDCVGIIPPIEKDVNELKAIITSEESHEYTEVMTDNKGRLISGIDKEGQKVEFLSIECKKDVNVMGRSIDKSLSDIFNTQHNGDECMDYPYILTDNSDRIILKISEKGEFEWFVGVPKIVRDYVETYVDSKVKPTEETKIFSLAPYSEENDGCFSLSMNNKVGEYLGMNVLLDLSGYDHIEDYVRKMYEMGVKQFV